MARTNLKQVSQVAYFGARMLFAGAGFAWRIFVDLSRFVGAVASAQLAGMKRTAAGAHLAVPVKSVVQKKTHVKKNNHKQAKPITLAPRRPEAKAAAPPLPKSAQASQQPGQLVPHGPKRSPPRHPLPASRPRCELGLPACLEKARDQRVRSGVRASCRKQQASALKAGLDRNTHRSAKANSHINKAKKQPRGHMH